MQNFNFLEKELLDIIFKGRNQQYGAYVLRKNYSQRIRNAMAITAAILLSIAGLFAISPGEMPPLVLPEFPTEDPHIMRRIEIDKPAIAKSGEVRKKVKTDAPPTEIVEDFVPVTKAPEIKLPPTDDIVTSPTGSDGPIVNPGAGGTGKTTTILPAATNGGEGTIAKKITPPTKPLITAQIMPEFPGGVDALMEYLQSHIKYPKLASSTGVAGTVYVEFVVSSSGKIQDVKLLNSIGAGCDQEAVRVIKSMPIWKPGIQDGHKVSVSFNIPVEFVL